ncbi:putative transporter [Alistipes indistinctus]|uniref:putative transporter n=2 Tax=Alistipes indistinctus TaxID=626932 RepID=UPI00241CDA08|nr:putative transporter [Alistipes indistinctus]
MEWLNSLFFGNESFWGGGVAHSVLILALVIALGIMLGKIKVAGISLGVTWILFVGIIFSHFGMRLNEHLIHFMKEFGLILFVYSIGLQVGPGFFSSFKKGGVRLNLLATMVVCAGVLVTCGLYVITGLPVTTMVGILSGAVTNTPGLGAAQQAYSDMTGIDSPDIALGYAVAYPLGVIGIILSMMVLRRVFRIDFAKEEKKALDTMDVQHDSVAQPHSLSVVNPALEDKSIRELQGLVNRDFVISRIRRQGGEIEIADDDTLLHVGDQILVVTTPRDAAAITAFIGRDVQVEWEQLDKRLISRRILITKPELNGKSLAQLKLHAGFGVSITRVNRAGVDLIAQPSLQLQMGDRVTVVGTEVSIANVEKVLGNSMKRLNAPNLIPIFIGIVLGVMLGSLPFTFPGIPQPVKLGLAGGPLIVSILISRFGPKFKLVTYTTMSANLMLREVGIALFLACVGLGAGEEFVETIIDGGGYAWIGYGAIITILPLLIVGAIGRLWFKVDYFTLIGVMAGATTDPPALAYSNDLAGNDIPSVGYATVYPLTMFLRVLSAQLLILFLA